VNRELAKKVADAVLYEGYMLYPYRPSAIKNRQRWTFGILYPPEFREVQQGTERAGMHSECLLTASCDARVQIQLRFLHLFARQVARAVEDRFEAVPSLVIDGQLVESWDEGGERSVEVEVALQDGQTRQFGFSFTGFSESEELRDSSGHVAGNVTRTQHEVRGRLAVFSQRVREGVWKLAVDITNQTDLPAEAAGRDKAQLRSMLSAHTILTMSGGEFVSLLDPPEDLGELVSKCTNVGNFPVLVGQDGEHDMLLCSAIVLYDYPQIAPESAGDFYDATEMDEMLTLRVMTLTVDEKSEMARADAHARNLLERTEESAREQLARTHGAIRGMRPVSEKR
jgi:hypothetical protein